MKQIFFFFLLILTLPVAEAQTTGTKEKEIIGYYPSWQMYRRGGVCLPENLDYRKYTILNYSFFAPDTNGYLAGTDFWADSILLRGKIDWNISTNESYYYIPHTSLIEWAHMYGVKVMVSIGGWTLSDNFPRIAADSVKRARFASECVRIIKEYKFDGIDIDWEYPGYAEHSGGPDDKKNFTLFMKGIRDSINALGKLNDTYYLFTAAFGANKTQMDNIEWDKIKDIMDYINLMTYDFNGAWSPDASHHSALYEPAKGWGGSADKAVRLMTQDYQVPFEKLNIGAAFYGRSLLMKEEKFSLHDAHTAKSDSITFPIDLGMPMYFEIYNKMKKYTQMWDSVSQAPYLVGSPSKGVYSFVSYDNEKSIEMKAKYVQQKNLAGVIIWDISGDYLEKSEGSGMIKGTPLVDVLYNTFQISRKKPIKTKWRY